MKHWLGNEEDSGDALEDLDPQDLAEEDDEDEDDDEEWDEEEEDAESELEEVAGKDEGEPSD